MRNILLELSFLGTNYAGWQRQKNALAIQQVLEKAVKKITSQAINITGCSRTDAGVHAEHYIANFITKSDIPVEKFALAIQSHLPADILIKKSTEVEEGFNSRYNAYQKTYRYQMFQGKSPFYRHRWWLCQEKIDFERLKSLSKHIQGCHDFSGFCVQKSLKKNNSCEIKQAAWRKDGRKLYFKITGDRFLHHMVRFLVGAQIEVAIDKMTEKQFVNIIEHPNKYRAKYPAPADGLYLVKVKYK